MEASPLCDLRNIRKTFGGVRALDGVDLEIRRGEIHALVGENGAGKSTLIRILCGVIQADSGEVRFDGRPVRLSSPRAARALGVAAAHQDPRLFASRSAEENCFNQRGLPGGALISWSAVRRESGPALRSLGARFPGGRTVSLLSASQRQMVALAGAFLAAPRLVILDEPTATLSAGDSEKLFAKLRAARGQGASIIYVSHRLEEVLALADRITILRDGRVVRTVDASGIDTDSLVEAMVGRRIETLHPRPPEPVGGEAVLEVAGLDDVQGAFRDVSLAVRPGEVLGIYGLVGAGRTEIGQALAGFRPSRGQVARRGSIAYLPEDRLREGNLPGLSVRENLSIACLRSISRGPFPDRKREKSLADSLREKFRIRAPSLEAEIGTLSGGNQQKALLARWLPDQPRILILDEPTQGVDVGAKVEIHQIIDHLAREGVAVILISSDLPEVRGLSHRLMVIREGRPSAEFVSSAAGEEEIARAAFPLAGPDQRGAASAAGQKDAPGKLRRSLERPIHREIALVAAIAILLVATGLKAPAFISSASLWDSAANSAALALAALGQTLVIASGAIDISIGSTLALSATAAVLAAGPSASAPLAFAAAILLGTVLGSLNALISFFGRLHPIITTMGTLGIFHGLFLRWKGGEWLILPDDLRSLATEGPLGVPVSVWGVGAVAATLFWFLRWTRSGRACLKVGDDPEAAQVHGLRVGLARWMAFAILGASTGLAGLFHTARYGSVQNNTGDGFEIQAIAAAVLGGAHVTGGRGTVAGALLGAAFIGLLQDARSVWGIQERWQLVIIGSLMLGTLSLETLLGRWSREEAEMSAASSPYGRREAWLLIALVILTAIFSVLSSHFRSPIVFLDQSRYWTEVGILAPFALLVIISGGIDLSVASILALSGVTTVRLMVEGGVPVGWAILLGLFLGTAAGALNGALIVFAKIPDLVVTLATMGIYRGLAQVVAQNRVYSNLPTPYRFFGQEFLGGVVPIQWVIFFALWAAAFIILHRTLLGRYVYAVGSSPLAARFARVPAGRTRILVYALSGLSAAMAAVVHTACSDTAKYDDAKGFELEAIACVVLGGASISGGRGSAPGLLLGVLLLGVLRTGLDLCGVPGDYKRFATGAILIATAAANQRLAGRTGR